jgi:hypothetical protein
MQAAKPGQTIKMKSWLYVLAATVVVGGCAIQPANEFAGARAYELSNRHANARTNPDGLSSWNVAYTVSGVYKIDRKHNRVLFRIDQLDMQFIEGKFRPQRVTNVQVGYCYFTEDGWARQPRNKSASEWPKVDITLDPLKNSYSKTNIGSVSVPIDPAVDLNSAWPCGALWEASTGRSEGNIPAHNEGLQTLE